MTRWDDQFESHAIFPAIQDTRKRLELAEEEVGDDVSLREAQARIGRVLDHLEATLKDVDPELVASATLDQITAQLGPLATYLQNFFDAPDTSSYLDNANAHADVILPLIAQLPRRATGDVQELQNAVSSFRRSAGQHLRYVEEEAEKAREKLTSIQADVTEQETKIKEQDTRLDTVVTEYQAQFSTAQAERQTAFSQALEEARAEVRTNIEESEATIATNVTAARTELDEALASAKKDAIDQHAALGEKGEERIKELDELLAKAVKTVGALGSTALAGGYQIVANAERKSADWWRSWTALALLGAIAATIFAVAHGIENGFQVSTFFAKWAISVPFAALAAYAGHESSKHREQARIYRKIELQLASLDAYLVTLPEEKQAEIRERLAERFFGDLGGPLPELEPPPG